MQMMGQASDLEITANEIMKIRARYNDIVAAETGGDPEKITADADRDFWLSASEAVEYGLVSKVIQSRTELDGGL
jgi:ATP-dependent Clp protease protease subunit